MALTSNSDPYYAAQDEVRASLRKATFLYDEWQTEVQRIQGPAPNRRLEDLSGEVFNELRQIDFDLQDIEATIKVVEANPNKFNLDQAEVESRKHFVSSTRQRVKALQEKAKSMSRQKQLSSATHRIDRQNDEFVRTQQDQQQILLRQQDEHLEELAHCANRLHNTAVVINEELEDQQRMLSELDEDIDRQAERMNFVMRKMSVLLKTNDTKQLCMILWLAAIAIFLLFLVIVT